jgi:hypothetical protein
VLVLLVILLSSCQDTMSDQHTPHIFPAMTSCTLSCTFPADIVEIKHIMLPPSPRDFKDIYVVFELMETDLHQVGTWQTWASACIFRGCNTGWAGEGALSGSWQQCQHSL